jgi:hypothetical protein
VLLQWRSEATHPIPQVAGYLVLQSSAWAQIHLWPSIQVVRILRYCISYWWIEKGTKYSIWTKIEYYEVDIQMNPVSLINSSFYLTKNLYMIIYSGFISVCMHWVIWVTFF